MLKVRELVAKLKRYNQEAIVIIQSTGEEDDRSYAYNVNWCYEEDGETNKNKVIIE